MNKWQKTAVISMVLGVWVLSISLHSSYTALLTIGNISLGFGIGMLVFERLFKNGN